MFTFVQASRMKNDFVYQYSLQQSRGQFQERYQQALELCAGEELFRWNQYLTDELELWKEIAHPVFLYWSDSRLKPAVLQQDKVALRRENRQLARFFLIPLYKRGVLVPQVEVELDDRGELRFPGHGCYLAFGAEHAEETVRIELAAERVNVTVAGQTWGISRGEWLGELPVCTPILRPLKRIGDTQIDWQMSDVLLRQFVDGEFKQRLTAHIQTECVDLPHYEAFTLADAWYYEKAMEVIRQHWPELYEEVAAHLRMVVILNNQQIGGGTTVTFQGAIFLSHRPEDLHWTIENLIHEFGHSRLYQLCKLDPLLLNDSTDRHHSPWRHDLRPLTGIYHGAYVFTRVAIWYDILLEKNPDAQEVLDRLAVVLRQTHQAADTLLSHGDLTPIGKALLDEMIDIYTRIATRRNVHLKQGSAVKK